MSAKVICYDKSKKSYTVEVILSMVIKADHS